MKSTVTETDGRTLTSLYATMSNAMENGKVMTYQGFRERDSGILRDEYPRSRNDPDDLQKVSVLCVGGVLGVGERGP